MGDFRAGWGKHWGQMTTDAGTSIPGKQKAPGYPGRFGGDPGGIRTHNQWIKRRLGCQFKSYHLCSSVSFSLHYCADFERFVSSRLSCDPLSQAPLGSDIGVKRGLLQFSDHHATTLTHSNIATGISQRRIGQQLIAARASFTEATAVAIRMEQLHIAPEISSAACTRLAHGLWTASRSEGSRVATISNNLIAAESTWWRIDQLTVTVSTSMRLFVFSRKEAFDG